MRRYAICLKQLRPNYPTLRSFLQMTNSNHDFSMSTLELRLKKPSPKLFSHPYIAMPYWEHSLRKCILLRFYLQTSLALVLAQSLSKTWERIHTPTLYQEQQVSHTMRLSQHSVSIIWCCHQKGIGTVTPNRINWTNVSANRYTAFRK